MSERNNKGHFAMFFAQIIFGINTPIVKTLLSGSISPLMLNFFRFFGGAILFWLASFFIKSEKVRKFDYFLFLCGAITGVTFNQITFVIGLSHCSPIDSALIVMTTPMITMVLAALFLKEPITFLKVAGILVGASGVMFLLDITALKLTVDSLQGYALIFASCLSFACYVTFFKKVISRYSPITSMKWMFLFSIFLSLPFCYNDISTTNFSEISYINYIKIAYIIIFASFLAYTLIPIGQKHLRPTTMTMYGYLQPIITAFTAIVMGLAFLNWRQIVATILVFIGVYMVTKSKSRDDVEKKSTKIQH